MLRVILLVVLCGWSYSQAPGDGDDDCFTTLHPTLGSTCPANIKPLMDSHNYKQLLGSNNPVWQQVDVDMSEGNGTHVTSWTQTTSFVCRHGVAVCGFEVPPQDNWLITQHISRNISGILLDQAIVQVEFEFNGCTADECAQMFTIQRFDTSIIDPTAAANVSNYHLFDTIAPASSSLRQNASVVLNFEGNETGFYLAIRDQSSCLTIHRILVFYYVCPAVTQDLIIHPETRAPPGSEPITVMGTCIDSALPVLGERPVISCLRGGVWSTVSGCQSASGTCMAPVKLDVFFINDTPRLEGRNLSAQFTVTRTGVRVLCYLDEYIMKEDCSSGIISLYNLTPRTNSPLFLKVVVRDRATREKAVIGRRIYVHPDETFCSVILINRGVSISGDNATVEFQGVGNATKHFCVLDRMQFFRCESPHVMTGLSPGNHHFKIIPVGCGRNRKEHPLQFHIS